MSNTAGSQDRSSQNQTIRTEVIQEEDIPEVKAFLNEFFFKVRRCVAATFR